VLGAQPPTRQRQADIAAACHNLGDCAQDQGQLDEAEDWYRQSLAIEEDLGNRPGMALTYAQLGLLAEETGQPTLALERNIRCVLMFEEFPHPMSGTGPTALVRLTRQLGVPALERAWRQITGQALPQDRPRLHRQPYPGAGGHQ
jgi:tetratricopeptide (TPR) repeat protein